MATLPPPRPADAETTRLSHDDAAVLATTAGGLYTVLEYGGADVPVWVRTIVAEGLAAVDQVRCRDTAVDMARLHI